jgi:hypothetical protein
MAIGVKQEIGIGLANPCGLSNPSARLITSINDFFTSFCNLFHNNFFVLVFLQTNYFNMTL